MEKFWEVKNDKKNKTGELILFGDISNYDYWDEDVTPNQIKEDLDSLEDVNVLNVKINSQGGSLFGGMCISNLIRDFGIEKETKTVAKIMGIAASAMTMVTAVCDEVHMYTNSLQMIHKPWSFFIGNADDLRSFADDLDDMTKAIVNAYEEKTGLSKEKIENMISEETWLDCYEAKQLGFCDKIIKKEVSSEIKNEKIVAFNGVEFDFSKYNSVPEKIVAKINNKKNKGVKHNMSYKEFKTEQDYSSAVEKIKEDYKVELKENEEFVNDLRKGYVSIDSIIDKFKEINLEGDDLETIVGSVKELQSNYKAKKREHEEFKTEVAKEKLFNARKQEMEKSGLDITEEDKEEIINMSDKQFKLVIKAAKTNKDSNEEEDEVFDPNALIGDNNDDNIVNAFC